MNKVTFSSLRNADTFYLEDNDSDEYRLLNAYVKVARGCIVYPDKESWFKERTPVVAVEKPEQIPYFKKTNLSYWLRRAFGSGF